MADSDNSTTLPSVIYRSDGTARAGDSAIALLGCCQRAKERVNSLGSLIDTFEKSVLGSRHTCVGSASGAEAAAAAGRHDRIDADPYYRDLSDAEAVAALAEESLIDLLPSLEAQSLDGIIAKLEIIVGADGMIEDTEEFPMPQIRSVLEDMRRLTKIGGELGNCRVTLPFPR